MADKGPTNSDRRKDSRQSAKEGNKLNWNAEDSPREPSVKDEVCHEYR